MMTSERTFDVNLIKNIVTRDDIWKTVAEDGQKKEDFIPFTKADCWLKVTSGADCVGLFLFERKNKVLLEVHPFILTEFRGKIGHLAGVEHLKWIYKNDPKCQKIIGSVPVIYKHVKMFANMLGYRDEGISKASYMKNGRLHDQWYLGITRKEIARAL